MGKVWEWALPPDAPPPDCCSIWVGCHKCLPRMHWELRSTADTVLVHFCLGRRPGRVADSSMGSHSGSSLSLGGASPRVTTRHTLTLKVLYFKNNERDSEEPLQLFAEILLTVPHCPVLTVLVLILSSPRVRAIDGPTTHTTVTDPSWGLASTECLLGATHHAKQSAVHPPLTHPLPPRVMHPLHARCTERTGPIVVLQS